MQEIPDPYHALLRHEERLRIVEEKVATHEAVCAARYQSIIEKQTDTKHAVEQLQGMLKDNVRYMLWALIALALASVFGAEFVTKLIGDRV